jgi:hypothetical protein
MRVTYLESRVENKAVQYAESLDMLSFKLTPAGQRGWMDRLFITVTGIHFYIEFKREGKELTKLQEYRRYQLQKRKCNVYGPVDDLDQVKEIIDYYARISVQETGVDPA